MYFFDNEDNEEIDKLHYEKYYLDLGYKYICGIDEVGRGSLFGEVTACAVIMPLDDDIIKEANDSKKLTAKKREELYKIIIQKALSYSVYSVAANTIDKINIYNATKLAMLKAVEGLSIKPDILLIDAMKIDTEIKQESIIKGDLKSYSIACASIVAKVSRDKAMDRLSEKNKEYDKYKISKNKGYGTKEHIEAIKKYGASDLHRLSFEPIKSIKEENSFFI